MRPSLGCSVEVSFDASNHHADFRRGVGEVSEAFSHALKELRIEGSVGAFRLTEDDGRQHPQFPRSYVVNGRDS